MKIAFVGKGGSGKTTLTSLVARQLAKNNLPVLAIDADINQHLAESLGLSETEAKDIPALGLNMDRIKSYLRGDNEFIRHHSEMIKTTPPGRGSRLLRVSEKNEIYNYFAKDADGVKLMVTGPLTEEDIGVRCYHSKTGAAELILNHLVDGKKEYALVDMTAGADSFASGLFTKFDVTFIVVEPTLKSVGVYKQYKEAAGGYDTKITVIGNKITSSEDLDFIRNHVGEDLIAGITASNFIKSLERGERPDFSNLEAENLQSIQKMISYIDSQEKDWTKFYKHAVHFHVKNAESWANKSMGLDLRSQIDPEFSFEVLISA